MSKTSECVDFIEFMNILEKKIKISDSAAVALAVVWSNAK